LQVTRSIAWEIKYVLNLKGVPAIPGEAENALKLGVKGKGLS
jgi:hypothetical protein